MSPRTPEDCDRMFAERVAAGDLDGLVALYEPNGAFVPQDGSVVNGIAAIREALAGFASMKPKLTMNIFKVARVGDDLAVLYNNWSLSMTGPDGKPVDRTGKAVEICRRQKDGLRLFALDDPFARG